MSSPPAARRAAEARFKAPEAATPLTTRPAWVVFWIMTVVGVACMVAVRETALWPTPMPVISVVALAVVISIANNFGTFETVEGLAEYTSLGMPVAFAALLLLDWRDFVLALALGELFAFVSEEFRHKNVTVWYIRICNVCLFAACGAAAIATIGLANPVAHGAWNDVALGLSLVFAALLWKMIDSVGTAILVTLAAGKPLRAVKVPPKAFFSQFALFLIGIPVARLWADNVWLSLFALAPLGVAYGLLALPELEHRVRTDERTGLTNAGAFDRLLETEVEGAETRGTSVALLTVDIDHFKYVNDTFGHPAGDVVIAGFADVLAGIARSGDIVARIGGEEFAILVRNADRSSAMAFAERLREDIEARAIQVPSLPDPVAVTASIGVALFPADAANAGDLFEAADAALYAAKREGRNRVRDASTALSRPRIAGSLALNS